MGTALRFAFGFFVLLTTISLCVWALWWLLKNSYDPAALAFRWVMTLVVVVGGYFFIDWIVGPNGGALEKIVGVFAGMFLALVLAALWVPAIVGKVSDAIGGLYTGGSEPPRPQPFYSIAETRRKQGRYKEAIYEIQKELAKFPSDVTGHVLLASIQAENLNDLPAAQLTMEKYVTLPELLPVHIAYAMNALADWCLKVHDTDGARLALDKIIELLPDTEQSRIASQRIAHLASKETLLAAHEHKPITLKQGMRYMGLMDQPASLAPVEDLSDTAQKLVDHLTMHPLDNEARERLAMIYADHYQRLDLATDQLEQLIATPNQSGKEVARWLNVLADLQIKYGVDIDGVKQTLQRILDLFPGLAAAQLAQQRLEFLPLEFKGKQQGQSVKMGTYEKDLGLKKHPS